MPPTTNDASGLQLGLIEELAERLGPWTGAAINLFEVGIRATSDVQRIVARRIDYEPVQTVMSATADLTRDTGAAYASCARWLLRA